MAIFGPKPWHNPFGKLSIIRLFKLLVCIAQKGVFSFLNIVKDIFWPISPQKKSCKNGHFWTKTMRYSFGKMSIFGLFEHLIFIA